MSQPHPSAPLVANTEAGPRIYVACLAAYNHGILHWCWITADLEEAHIRERVRAMLAASPMLAFK